ncbi:MAG TPA: ribosome biogenesis GTPase Der [Candidatus Saccharimonadales bacterium]|nr:ribosome biogenesis GTPase Der [Candidatus Saccharimonadales bacterium]
MEAKKILPLVAICGRTNVGKSTLFNCLTEKNQALVSDIAGTTRDSNLGTVEWSNSAFDIIDTAGLIDWKYLTAKKLNGVSIDEQTQKQAKKYLDKADLILFVVDSKVGILPEDKELATVLKKTAKYRSKLMLIANKVDNFKNASEAAQFNKLNLGEPFTVSAASGMGTGDLLDKIIERIDKGRKFKKTEESDEENKINVCIIGKPNVGKSSLLNSILGYERVIVSPLAHTTREPQHTNISYAGHEIKLVDTAGISKQGTKTKGLEKPGILKSLKSLEKAEIAMLVLDISEPLTHQDSKLIQEIVDRHKSLIFIANKWDLIPERNTKKWTEILYDKMPFATWAPVQFISAKTGEKVNKILDLIININAQRRLELSDSQTEKFLKYVVKIHKPAKGKGLKAPHIYEFRQKKSNPPAFILRIGPNDDLHFSYVRFVENRLREKYGLIGTPIKITVTKNRKSHTTYQEPKHKQEQGHEQESSDNNED